MNRNSDRFTGHFYAWLGRGAVAQVMHLKG